jgi:hypothetical protein
MQIIRFRREIERLGSLPARLRSEQRLLCQYLYFCTSNASKLSTWRHLMTSARRASGTSKLSGHRIAIVCHGGVINAYLTYILGLSNYQQGFFYPNYTSIHRVAAARSGERSIVTINETSHLRGTGLPMGLFQKG